MDGQPHSTCATVLYIISCDSAKEGFIASQEYLHESMIVYLCPVFMYLCLFFYMLRSYSFVGAIFSLLNLVWRQYIFVELHYVFLVTFSKILFSLPLQNRYLEFISRISDVWLCLECIHQIELGLHNYSFLCNQSCLSTIFWCFVYLLNGDVLLVT